MKQPEIYFHVGLGKVASTYLQHRFFPKLKGIHYIKSTRYRRSPKIIKDTNYDKYFLSREFDQQLEDEVKWFSSYYPNARPIIIFRRHDGWIASQYRRYIKNGGYLPFDEFFDVENDRGLWKIKHVTFYTNLEILEKYFGTKPLVLFHDELKEDAWAFFDKIADFCGVTYNRADISLAPVHRSYSEKQLRIMRSVARNIFGEKPPEFSTQPLLHWLQRRGRLLACYGILYPAQLAPSFVVPDEPLTPKEDLKQIRDFFEEDWDRLRKYAEEYNPSWRDHPDRQPK
ncbi:MAG: hypothetical protein H6573_20495 [Lewinellaceae bacterium]|nr:hypothetical protein [Lewinellaceae bacterium]